MFSIAALIMLSLLTFADGASAVGPAAVNLRTAGNWAILASTGVSTVPPSAITGNIGLSPAASTFLTGFSPTLAPAGTSETSAQVTGLLAAANMVNPTPQTLTTAVSDMQTAFTDANSRPSPNFSNLNNGNLTAITLTPGLYKWSSGVSVAGTVTISGKAADTWIFQVAGTLTFAAGSKIVLSGGAVAKNIVWVVAGAVNYGAASHFEGILLAKTAVTLQTGTTGNGRVLSQTFVALQKATIAQPA